MVEGTAGRDRINWRILLYAVISAIAVMLLLFVYDSDPRLSFGLFIVPVAGLASFITLLSVIAFRKRRRQSLSVLLALAAFLVTSGALLKTQGALRPSLRWLLWSHRLKAQVLAQSAFGTGELEHIEWDGWGGTPVGDWLTSFTTRRIRFQPRPRAVFPLITRVFPARSYRCGVWKNNGTPLC